jgi:DNA-binding transcriptional MocR family regulator
LGDPKSLFSSVNASKIPDMLYKQLVSLITQGHIEPGERHPSERDLAMELGVGRQSIREARKCVQEHLDDVERWIRDELQKGAGKRKAWARPDLRGARMGERKNEVLELVLTGKRAKDCRTGCNTQGAIQDARPKG